VISHTRSTNVVYQLDLGDGISVAYKPDHGRYRDWWRHEVAAYRLARVLGIASHVPPSVGRRVALSVLRRTAPGDDLLPARDNASVAAGSATFWMPRLVPVWFSEPSREVERRWNGWLDPARPLPAQHSQRAREMATLLVFDYLQANEDRFNGANLRTDERDRIVYRDNNNGWFVNVLNDLSWGARRLRMARRFPRSLVRAVERADAAALRREIERDPSDADKPLLSEAHYRAYERRRQHVLEHFRRVIARYGEAAVYAWQ
jgi:hypothetical protein